MDNYDDLNRRADKLREIKKTEGVSAMLAHTTCVERVTPDEWRVRDELMTKQHQYRRSDWTLVDDDIAVMYALGAPSLSLDEGYEEFKRLRPKVTIWRKLYLWKQSPWGKPIVTWWQCRYW